MMVGGLIPPSPPSHLARNTTLPPHLWTMHMPSSHCWTTKYGMVSTNSKHKSSACIFSGQSSRKFYTNRSWFTNLETKLYQNSLIETKTFVCLDTVYFSRENSSILVFTTCSKVTKNSGFSRILMWKTVTIFRAQITLVRFLFLKWDFFWTLSNTVMNVFSKKMDGFEQVKRVFYRDF